MSDEKINSDPSSTKDQPAIDGQSSHLQASPTNESKLKEGNSNAVSLNPESGELSIEAIEAEINKSDPLFSIALEEVREVKLDGLEVMIESYNAENELESYFRHVRESKGFKKWLFRIFPFLPKAIQRFAALRVRLISAFLHFFTVLVPYLLKTCKVLLTALLGLFGKGLQSFKKKKAKQKVAFVFFIAFVGVGTYATWFLWSKKPLDQKQELFVNSIEEFATSSYKYDPKSELEPFYNNYRVSQNIITIPRMIMNIKASENSGPNPMAALELFIEGGSPEVVVEIKDREAEMKDVMQRAVEEMSFDDLIVPEGKQAMSDRLRREINRILTKGKVRKIFLKSAVFKP